MCDYYGGKPEGTKNVMLFAFGVGLSWGVSYMKLNTDAVLPIVYSDEYFEDGLLED